MKQLLLTTIAAVVLVGCGPSVGIRDAVTSGNIEAVKEHIAAGTDLNALDDDGGTPLALAIRSGNTETADLLRKHGDNALHYARNPAHKHHPRVKQNRQATIDLLRK